MVPFFLIAVGLAVTSSAQTLVGDDDKGAPCVDSAGNPGVCSLLNQCASLRNRSIALQQQSVCGTGGSTTRVCCAEQSASAEAKCRRFVSPRDCGLSTFLSGRIANGLPVDSVTDFPWMALLQYSSGPISRCGGAIINDRWILTAAQCINSAGPVKVLLGDLNLATSTDDSFQHPPRVYNVEKAVKHPEYKRIVRGNRNGLFNDIALIKLTERISISPVMKPLCISEFPRPVSDLDGQAAYVAGWGVTEFVGPAEVLMRWARIGITRHAQCQEVYNSVYTAVDTTHVCANGEDERGGVDACAGDTGGPLMQQRQRNNRRTWFAAGVVSFRRGCGDVKFPSVYTRVDSFLDWIGCTVARN